MHLADTWSVKNTDGKMDFFFTCYPLLFQLCAPQAEPVTALHGIRVIPWSLRAGKVTQHPLMAPEVVEGNYHSSY